VHGGRARPVTVIGAGPAGLAVAACLRRRGVGGTVLERGGDVGTSWRERYERLHLHTPRIQSHLPGYRMPHRYGRWVARRDVVDYLDRYAAHHHILPRFGVEVERLDRDDARWRLTTSVGELLAEVVVVATGYNNVPFVPAWPGRDGYRGTMVHAASYRTPDPYAGRDVLVVGAGNSGAEIAADLAEHGAGRVRLSLRTPPNVVPLTMAGIPTTLIGIANEFTPAVVGDPVNRLLQRLTIGGPDTLGLGRPPRGIIASHRATDAIPIIDVGLVRQLASGRVQPVAAVAGLEREAVVLADGSRLTPDVVIAATGYRTGLEPMLGHLGVLDERGRPAWRTGEHHPATPGLYAVGLRNPLIGLLNAIRIDAWRVARAIERTHVR
jgi:putative flavoprotein involved in K+ transport